VARGRLELDFRVGPSVVRRHVTQELALAPGEQTLRLFLPPIPQASWELVVEARFRSAEGVLDLGLQPVVSGAGPEQAFVVGIVQTSEEAERHPGWLASIRLETYEAKPRELLNRGVAVPDAFATLPRRFDPLDLPSRPLEYCALDVLLLAGNGFALLEDAQLEAAAQWVEAGGALLVVPESRVEDRHARFLNRLAGGGGGGPAVTLAESGAVEAGAGFASQSALPALAASRLGCYRAGLGRVVLALDPDSIDAKTPAWRAALGFLWSLKRPQADAFTANGQWGSRFVRPRERTDQADVDGRGRDPAASIAQALFPEEVQALPAGLVFLLLAAFLLAVGPLDYWVLGKLKRRRLTWITFPALCIAFTLLTMSLAETYLGANASNRRLRVIDVGEGGRVLRANAYELIFHSREGERAEDLANAVHHPISLVLDGSDFSLPTPFRRSGEAEDLRTEGEFPGRYTVRRRVAKWRPYLSRTFAIGPAAAGEGLPIAPEAFGWDVVTREALETMNPAECRSKLLPRSAPPFRIDFVHLGERQFAIGGELLRAPDVRFTYLDSGIASEAGWDQKRFPFARLSPKAGAAAEDVVLLDPEDSSQWLVTVVVEDGGDIVIYRRLYHFDAAAAPGKAPKETPR
jgi:hypothetical protein